MVIERKSLLEMQLVDYHLTGAVRETPFFIGKLAEGLPTQQDVGFSEVIDGGQGATKELLAHGHSTQRLPTCLQERQCLIDDVVRSDQRLGVLTQPTSRRSMIPVRRAQHSQTMPLRLRDHRAPLSP